MLRLLRLTFLSTLEYLFPKEDQIIQVGPPVGTAAFEPRYNLRERKPVNYAELSDEDIVEGLVPVPEPFVSFVERKESIIEDELVGPESEGESDAEAELEKKKGVKKD
jgi:hypothetical protein